MNSKFCWEDLHLSIRLIQELISESAMWSKQLRSFAGDTRSNSLGSFKT